MLRVAAWHWFRRIHSIDSRDISQPVANIRGAGRMLILFLSLSPSPSFSSSTSCLSPRNHINSRGMNGASSLYLDKCQNVRGSRDLVEWEAGGPTGELPGPVLPLPLGTPLLWSWISLPEEIPLDLKYFSVVPPLLSFIPTHFSPSPSTPQDLGHPDQQSSPRSPLCHGQFTMSTSFCFLLSFSVHL